jgi:hypothetical protein
VDINNTVLTGATVPKFVLSVEYIFGNILENDERDAILL